MKKVLVYCVVGVMAVGCSTGEQCQDLVLEKCIKCHSVATSCAKVGMGEKWWAGILDSMVLLGTDLSKKERAVLAQCLSEPVEELAADKSL